MSSQDPTQWMCEQCGNKLHNCSCPIVRPERKLKALPTVTVLPVVTTHDLDAERVLQAAIDAKPQYVVVIGQDADGELYFASSKADGGEVLWWMEKAKKALMEVTL